jgi:hypothetical protein
MEEIQRNYRKKATPPDKSVRNLHNNIMVRDFMDALYLKMLLLLSHQMFARPPYC